MVCEWAARKKSKWDLNSCDEGEAREPLYRLQLVTNVADSIRHKGGVGYVPGQVCAWGDYPRLDLWLGVAQPLNLSEELPAPAYISPKWFPFWLHYKSRPPL